MKFVNRGYIVVRPTKEFINWANQNDEDFEDLADNEASIYLIEEDFYDDEPVIKSHFKKIFLNELQGVSEDSASYPEISFETFNLWFDLEIGSTVFDTQKDSLIAD